MKIKKHNEIVNFLSERIKDSNEIEEISKKKLLNELLGMNIITGEVVSKFIDDNNLQKVVNSKEFIKFLGDNTTKETQSIEEFAISIGLMGLGLAGGAVMSYFKYIELKSNTISSIMLF